MLASGTDTLKSDPNADAAGQLPPEGAADHADREAAVQRPLPLYARVILKGDAIKGTVFGPDGTHPRIIQEPA
jgi:hypothetical protein